MSPIPPAVSATVTMRAPKRRQAPAAGFHETGGGAEVEGLDQPRLDHRGTDADAENQQAEVGGGRGHRGVSTVAMSPSVGACEDPVGVM